MILDRNTFKIHQLGPKTYILTSGMYADMCNLWKKLDTHISLYKLNNGRDLSSTAISNLLSRMLYEKRFFPFYTFNLVVGFDDKGKPKIWGYDAVGSYKDETFGAVGSALLFMVPYLDQKVRLSINMLYYRVKQCCRAYKGAKSGVSTVKRLSGCQSSTNKHIF